MIFLTFGEGRRIIGEAWAQAWSRFVYSTTLAVFLYSGCPLPKVHPSLMKSSATAKSGLKTCAGVTGFREAADNRCTRNWVSRE
jgi:hypothetical protein